MSGKVLISPSELSDLMKAEPVVLIDTRDPAIYAEAHIPGAVDVREVFTYLASSTPEGMTALRNIFAAAFGKAGLSGAETAVIYEQSMSAGFGQSCRGYVLLRYLGYPKVRVLHGGYAAWVAAGLPSTTTVPTPVAKAFPINTKGMGILVDLETMKAAVKDPVPSNSMSGMWMSGLLKAPRLMERISARAKAVSRAQCGSNGTE
jgi:thiosulfate/3-mercaptopyruvate sulfurtransferase